MVTPREDCPAREALRVWLASNDKTQAWLARTVGVSAPSVVAWLDGTSRPVSHLREVLTSLTAIPGADWEYPSERLARDQALARIAAETPEEPAA